MYSYHYMNSNNQLIFRYDNARHRPPLSSLDHKHTPEQIIEAPTPALDDVMAEIGTLKGWV